MIRKKQQLINASDPDCFWINNGDVVRNLKQFAKSLESMSNEQFGHHVTKNKNDFAKWIKEILKDSECANAISKVRTRKTILSKVNDSLKKYSS